MKPVYSLVMVAALSAAAFSAGCATTDEPSALTGQTQGDEMREQRRWTDDKGHYRPEWRAGVNRPAGYPKNPG